METNSTEIRSTQKNRIVLILLAILIITELIFTGYVCLVKKQFMFSDEIWSYGLSNSYYQPFVYLRDGVRITEDTPDDVINMDHWIEGSVFEDYITVRRGERFAYGSVVHNQSLDFHPPLYYTILHTVCSFFPDKYSKLFAFVPSCIFLVVTQIFLFLLAELVTKDKLKALLVCLLYGGGQGALSTFIYLRQYNLLTMLVVMHVYFAARIYFGKELKPKLVVGAAVTAFCAFMTHYYGIAFIGVFTAAMCLSFLCRKNIKQMFIYGGSISGSLGLFLVIYPAAVYQIIHNDAPEEHVLDFSTQYRRIICYITDYCFGYRISVFRNTNYAYVLFGFVCLLIVAVPLIFVLRKNEKVRKCFAGLKSLPEKCLHADHFCLMLLTAIIAITIAVNYVIDPIDLGDQCARYVFMLFPLACLVFFRLLCIAADLLPKAEKLAAPVLSVCVAAVLVANNYGAENIFVFRGAGGDDMIRDALAGKNCVLFISGQDESWRMTCFSSMLGLADKVYIAQSEQAYSEAKDIMSERIDCIIVKTYQYTASEEQLEFMRENLPEGSEDFDIEENMNYEIPLNEDGTEDRFIIGNMNKIVDHITEGKTIMPHYVINANEGLYAVYFVE